MLRFFILFIGLQTLLLALSVDSKTSTQTILPHVTMHIDKTKSHTIDTIQSEIFKPIHKPTMSFGYSPNFYVWFKVTLTNPTSKPIQKVLEYANSLTSYVALYATPEKHLLMKDGLLATPKNRKTLHPTYTIVLQPKETKTFFLHAYSDISTLIAKLNLWNKDAFYAQDRKHQMILAFFLGAMGIVIIYNFFIFLSTQDRAYLYYVLFFSTITFHQLFYTGIANVYFLNPSQMHTIIGFSSFIVAIPVYFLARFTKSILLLEQYPKVYKVFHYYLMVFPFLVLGVHFFTFHALRNSFSVILALGLFGITLFAMYKKNIQAYYVFLTWLLFIGAGLAMYFSSAGILNVFNHFPYFTELALIVAAILFSFVLTQKIKQMHHKQLQAQYELVAHQASEQERLEMLIESKTQKLQLSLKEKELLLKELNHRVKNSIQTIVSFIRFQTDTTKDTKTLNLLKNLENRVLSINHLYSILHTQENQTFVNAYEYLSMLIDNIELSFSNSQVTITLHAESYLHSQEALYCGLIVNEALTNTLQHAFRNHKGGHAIVTLKQDERMFCLTIKDDGYGFDKHQPSNSLGLTLIRALATKQLRGTLEINTTQGTTITVKWKQHEQYKNPHS